MIKKNPIAKKITGINKHCLVQSSYSTGRFLSAKVLPTNIHKNRVILADFDQSSKNLIMMCLMQGPS